METMNRWGQEIWKFDLGKWLRASKLITRYLTDRDFRFQIECLWYGYNRECFKRNIMTHERIVLERVDG